MKPTCCMLGHSHKRQGARCGVLLLAYKLLQAGRMARALQAVRDEVQATEAHKAGGATVTTAEALHTRTSDLHA